MRPRRDIADLSSAGRDLAYYVVDADGERYGGYDVVGRSLRRDEVIGTPMAAQVFAIVDAVFEQDFRLFR